MKRAVPILLATAMAALSVPATAQTIWWPKGQAWPLCSDVIRNNCVVDGDTIRTGDRRIRLVDLDAPERGDGAKCARERRLGELAAGALSGLLTGGRVSYTIEGKDRYERGLWRLSVNGEPVADRMIAAGHAVRYGDGRPDWCRRD